MKIVCPVHSMTDCSPLLNGCSLVNWMHMVAAQAWNEGRAAGHTELHPINAFGDTCSAENPYE